jgi:hypothetical protein
MLTTMASHSEYPTTTLLVLDAMWEQPTRWQDGSALASQTGLTPEHLHLILRELADGGLAQTACPGGTPSGQPEAGRYRLTAEGLASAAVALAGAAPPTT